MVRSARSLVSGDMPLHETDEDLRRERLKAAIDELLDYCAEKEFAIPDSLKEALLHADEVHSRRSEKSSHSQLLSSYKEKQQQSSANKEDNKFLREYEEVMEKVKPNWPHLDLRIQNGSYTVTNYYDNTHERTPDKDEEGGRGGGSSSEEPRRAKQHIETCWNTSLPYQLFQCLVQCVTKGNVKKRKEEKIIMDGVNLALEPGKMYLVLGAPGSGKSTLLKMIADTLYKSKDHVPGGTVSLSSVKPNDVVWSNLVCYIDQIDRLHAYLTVYETMKFAWRCRSGGTHHEDYFQTTGPNDPAIAQLDEAEYTLRSTIEGLGLDNVRDTFVGDQGGGAVRGVSGGQKKRVTVGEMFVAGTLVACCDEISTGLDAATTFDIMRLIGATTRIAKAICLVSLLQPPPETVSTFDDLILISEGKVIYVGPVEDVVDYFQSLGYMIPERMDIADWLVMLPTKEGWIFLQEAGGDEKAAENNASSLMAKHLTTEQFYQAFYASERGVELMKRVEAPLDDKDANTIASIGAKKYQNPWYKSFGLLVSRELLLWWRDKYGIISKVFETILIGVINGTVFWQVGANFNLGGIISSMFNAMFYAFAGAMVQVAKQFPERAIFYKHQDANFFPTWTIITARTVSALPVALLDAVLFGSITFWFTGLAYDNGASIANYFMFMLLILATSLSTYLFLSVFSATFPDMASLQGIMAIVGVVFMLFCGFTIQPNVMPGYFIWIYWINLYAWLLRAFVLNEFQSGKYDYPLEGTNMTAGDYVLTSFGFTLDGVPFSFAWTWWGCLFALAYALLSIIACTVLLDLIRFTTGKSLVTDQGDDERNNEKLGEENEVEIPFQKVDLTFKGIRYTVKASTSNEKLELLKGIDGFFQSGRMTALMGSSGAGKTTLMDVLAMRKSSGEIEGEICLNGHPQEEQSFRRCTGYVEQFDVQSPQLTIRETVAFSAKLRLQESDPAVTPENMTKFVDQTLAMLELTNFQNLQVGSDTSGGLSFEQKKRLSIAVELAGSPSILFLDEPTSGLDSRAASIVMKGMRRIALSGRAVCATIHQPSIAVFGEFDSLLLLKRGGEVVFFGELGDNSSKLIEYLERYDATPRIQPGENPSTWMLIATGAGNITDAKPFDYAGSYANSNLRARNVKKIQQICAGATSDNKVEYPMTYATSAMTQSRAVMRRTMKIFNRSPSYNYLRMVVSVFVALLFSCAFLQQRVPRTEGDMNSRINSIFISTLFLGLNAFNSVLELFEMERNMFYRHKAANMYSSYAVIQAMTLAEIPFILLASVLFLVPFYFIMNFAMDPGKFFLFFFYNTFNLGVFTYSGQMFMSLLRSNEVAQSLGGVYQTLCSLFAGVFLRPQDIPLFWQFMYWVLPSHYIYEGIFMTQFNGDDTPILADPGSPFFEALNCTIDPCYGTAEKWVQVSFTAFSLDNAVSWNILYLVLFFVFSRIVTYLALVFLNFRNT